MKKGGEEVEKTVDKMALGTLTHDREGPTCLKGVVEEVGGIVDDVVWLREEVVMFCGMKKRRVVRRRGEERAGTPGRRVGGRVLFIRRTGRLIWPRLILRILTCVRMSAQEVYRIGIVPSSTASLLWHSAGVVAVVGRRGPGSLPKSVLKAAWSVKYSTDGWASTSQGRVRKRTSQ